MSNTYLRIQGCFTYLADMNLKHLKRSSNDGAYYDIGDPDGGESPMNDELN